MKLAYDDGCCGFLDSAVACEECERLRSDAVRSYRVFPFEEEMKKAWRRSRAWRRLDVTP